MTQWLIGGRCAASTNQKVVGSIPVGSSLHGQDTSPKLVSNASEYECVWMSASKHLNKKSREKVLVWNCEWGELCKVWVLRVEKWCTRTSPLSICNYHQSFQCMLLLTIIKYNGEVDEIGRTALLFPERRGSDSCQIHGSLFEYDFYTDSSKFSVLSGSPVFKSMYVSEM